MSMVNGRPLKEVLNELRAYREPPHKTYAGHKYFETSEFIGAFDEIVGVANYLVEYTDHSYQKISTGQELFSVKCIITIIDDDCKPVLKRECYGGYVCKYNDTGSDVNLQNSLDFVCSYAFKNAAKRFGIFGLKTTDIKGGTSDVVKDEKPANTDNGNKKSSEAKVINFVTEGAFENFREDNGRPVYRLSARQKFDDKHMSTTPVEIIFYPNQYSKTKEVAEAFNSYLVKCQNTQCLLRIKTKPSKNDENVLIFFGFASAS